MIRGFHPHPSPATLAAETLLSAPIKINQGNPRDGFENLPGFIKNAILLPEETGIMIDDHLFDVSNKWVGVLNGFGQNLGVVENLKTVLGIIVFERVVAVR